MLTDNNSTARARPARAYAQLPRFQRVKVSVLGRYMLADRREFPCQVLEMSPGDAVVIPPGHAQWIENRSATQVLEFAAIVSPPWRAEDDRRVPMPGRG